MCGYIKNELFSLQDKKYKEFNCRLIPEINADKILGVRAPELKQFAKRLQNEEQGKAFLYSLPHYYLEENNLHAYMINEIKDVDICISEIERFLPFIDNWATCDSLRPKVLKNNKDKLLPFVLEWIKSDNEFTCRFGIEMLMVHYLDGCFDIEQAYKVSEIKSDKYYINMMIAWYFATALAKQWDSIICIIEGKRLSFWVHNKTISKAVESFRITAEQKEYLKALRIKKRTESL